MGANMLKPNIKSIPEELKNIPRWCGWTTITRNGKTTKPPVNVKTGTLHKPNEPDTWHSFQDTWEFYQQNCEKRISSNFIIRGIGFLIDTPYVGIDLDNCLDKNGQILDWAKDIVQKVINITYVEVSPSGTGLHIFLQGEKTNSQCKKIGLGADKTGKIEIYDSGRYFTITGILFQNSQPTIAYGETIQKYLDDLTDFISQPNAPLPVPIQSSINERKHINTEGEIYHSDADNDRYVANIPDAELLNKARTAKGKSGAAFRSLFDEYHKQDNVSQNEDDLALCIKLAFWTRGDIERMDRLFRQSAMMRPKWDERRGGQTYGEMTINQALTKCDKVYSPISSKSQQPAKKEKPPKEPKQTDVLPMAEDDLAVRFVAKHKNNMRYCHNAGCWYGWNGQIWKKETTEQGIDLIRIVCKEAAELAGIKERKCLLRSHLYHNVEAIARTDRAVAVTSEIWDNNDFLLGTPNGTVDLETGELRKATQQDFITKSTLVAPTENVDAPIWEKFLNEATANNQELQRFLQQIAGMVLTGDTSEHVLIFVYGPGGNGKSVFLNVLMEILADYATSAPMETFINSPFEHHPTELAKLQGARLVTASETEEGRNWAESRIKTLTGGDKISARYMRQDFFEYWPKFKLVIIGNHKPSIKTLDDAIKRRINIIPFIQKPQKVDPDLNKKLRKEYPAILRWMINGCIDWQKHGLQRPECVKQATEDYFEDQDLFSQWINQCCNIHFEFKGKSNALFDSWKKFAEDNNIKAGNSKSFKSSMERRGFQHKSINTGRVFIGIAPKSIEENDGRYPD